MDPSLVWNTVAKCLSQYTTLLAEWQSYFRVAKEIVAYFGWNT